jgi:hypothetical protein
MNTKDILKYAAFAVAAYMLYRWAKDAGWLDKLVPGPAVTPDQKAIEAAAAAARKKAEEDAAAGKLTADQLAAMKAQIDAQAAQLKALAEQKPADGGGTTGGGAPPAAKTNDQLMAEAAPSGSALRVYLTEQAALGKTSLPMPAGSGTYNPIAVVRALGLKYNSDVWNYYRGEAGGDVPAIDLFPPGNRDYPMTIDEYLGARASAGLSGLGAGWHQLASMQSASPWIC